MNFKKVILEFILIHKSIYVTINEKGKYTSFVRPHKQFLKNEYVHYKS